MIKKPGNDLLFRVLRQSTIGAERLDFRVRYGIGYFPFAIITRQSTDTLIFKIVKINLTKKFILKNANIM